MSDLDHAQSILADDPITVPGQKFALISVVAPDKTNQKLKASQIESGQCALKIRGVFETKEEAQNHAQRLVRLDPLFDIMLVDLYRWVVVPPDPVELSQKVDEIYQEQFLTDLISGHKAEQQKSKQFFEERRMMDALESNPERGGSSSSVALEPVEESTEAPEPESDPKGKSSAS